MANEKTVKTFDGDYLVIDLVNEYGGSSSFVGKEKYAVATDLSEEKLLEIYEKELDPYKPFVIITREMYEAFRINFNEDERERKRDAKFHEAFTLDSESPPGDVRLDPSYLTDSRFVLDYILKRMMDLPFNEGTLLYKKCILGYSAEEIAEQEGLTVNALNKRLKKARAAMREIFQECGVIP